MAESSPKPLSFLIRKRSLMASHLSVSTFSVGQTPPASSTDKPSITFFMTFKVSRGHPPWRIGQRQTRILSGLNPCQSVLFPTIFSLSSYSAVLRFPTQQHSGPQFLSLSSSTLSIFPNPRVIFSLPPHSVLLNILTHTLTQNGGKWPYFPQNDSKKSIFKWQRS